MAEPTARQQDQSAIEAIREERLRQADHEALEPVDAGGCAPPVYVGGST